jgi:hypothetical protein
MHGMGVNMPSAAAVTAATIGLAMGVYIPKGAMFTNGLLSMMLAAGVCVSTRFSDSTANALGPTLKLHASSVPAHTYVLMVDPPPWVLSMDATHWSAGCKRCRPCGLLASTAARACAALWTIVCV